MDFSPVECIKNEGIIEQFLKSIILKTLPSFAQGNIRHEVRIINPSCFGAVSQCNLYQHHALDALLPKYLYWLLF